MLLAWTGPRPSRRCQGRECPWAGRSWPRDCLGYARLETRVTLERPIGRLFPPLHPEEIQNPGERAVARVLVEQLPHRVEVFHGFSWPARDRRGTTQEGDFDFVLLDRERGPASAWARDLVTGLSAS